jgi:hypothetical protein
MINSSGNFSLQHLHTKADITLNLEDTFDIFAQATLAEIYEDKVRENKKLYVACIIDARDCNFVSQASEIAKWHLNLRRHTLPTNLQNIKDLAIYCYDKRTKKFKFVCNQVELATQPFFACQIALHDSNVTKDELGRAYKILANCYHFGLGGAEKNELLANKYAAKYLELTKCER